MSVSEQENCTFEPRAVPDALDPTPQEWAWAETYIRPFASNHRIPIEELGEKFLQGMRDRRTALSLADKTMEHFYYRRPHLRNQGERQRSFFGILVQILPK